MFNKFFLFVLFVNLYPNLFNCQEYDNQAYLNLLKTDSSIQKLYLPHLNDYLYYIDLILNDTNRNISDKCENDLLHLKEGLLKKEEFALNFYEANAKDRTGILTGYNSDLGNFKQCIEIKVNQNLNYKGKYCLISVQSSLSNTVRNQKDYKQNLVGLSETGRFHIEFNLGSIYATCVPNSCNIQDLVVSINKESNKYGINVIGQNDKHCSSYDQTHIDEPYKWSEIICSIIVGAFIILCLSADYFESDLLRFFSIKRSLKKIYKIPDDHDTNIYNFIHGFKSLYVVLGMMAHACGVLYIFSPSLYANMRNFQSSNPLIKEFLKRLLVGPDIAIFIGGFLAIVAWHVVFISKRDNFFMYVLSRFFRTIPIIICVLILDRIWPRYTNGPFHRQLTDQIQKNCEHSFWKLFLFISNQDRALDICQVPSWFISVDFQLYVVHYFIIKYLIQKPKLGLALAFIQMICVTIYSAQDVFLNDLEPYFNAFNVYFYNTIRFEKQYFIASIHSNVYTFGVLTGYLVINRKKFEFLEIPLIRFLIFIFASLCTLSALYLPYFFGDYSHLPENNVLISILLSIWASTYRLLYLSIIFCSFYFLSFDYFKVAKKILSLKIWVPLSRLSYTLIMSQFIYLWYNAGNHQDLFRTSGLNLWKEAIFSLVVSLLIGHFVFIFLESPIQSILFHLTGLDKKKTKLKQDLSTARLHTDFVKDKADHLFIQNTKLDKPSIQIFYCDDKPISFEVKPDH